MAKADDAINKFDYFGSLTDNAGLNLELGGQNGANLALGLRLPNGEVANEVISNAHLVTQNAIPFLIDYPRGFDLLPNPEHAVRVLKELIENRTTTIAGINFGITSEREDVPMGRGANVHSEHVKTTGVRIEPVHGYKEALGASIFNFWETYISLLLGDVDMGFPLITRFEDYDEIEYTPDLKTFTVLYVIPDVAHKRAMKAVLQSNMMPDTTQLEFGRDLQAGGVIPDHSLNFGGISQTSRPVRDMGTKYLNELLSHNVRPDTIPAFVEETAPLIDDVGGGYNKVGNPPV